MRAAIYARRSTDEHQIESLDVQSTGAKTYIERNGWTLDPKHIFIDDAISRAEFKKRPGLIALLNGAESREFDVVVVRDETRLGGDTFRTGLVIQDLLDAKVRLHYYFTSEEVALENAVDKFMVAARNFAAELEREKTSQRTREHLLQKAQRGLVVGGRCYGYENVEVHEGERRTRVEYKIDAEQAAIVVEIFERYADGAGLKTIAKTLNARGIPSPQAGKRGTGSWSPGAIRAMLYRDRYRGILVYGKIKKGYRSGTKVRDTQNEHEWIRVDAPHLRIISEALWDSTMKRRGSKRERGRTSNRGATPKYLLSGVSRCGICGGPVKVSNSKAGQEVIKVYSCAYHRERGSCKNSLRRPVAKVDAVVIDWIRENVLTEAVITGALAELRRRIKARSSTSATEVEDLRKQAANLRKEIDRFVCAIASSDTPPTALVKALSEREEQVRGVDARIRVLQTAPSALDLEVRRLEKTAREKLAEFQSVLGRNPDQARKVVAALLKGPLTFSPTETDEGHRYRVQGELTADGLITIDSDPNGT